MSNTILTPTAVTREALRVLHQKLTFIGSINRQYDDSFAKQGAKIGTDLKIRLPNQYVVTDGAALTTQDTTESSTTLQVTTQKHVGMNFSSAELTLSMDDFSERVIEPAMAVLAAAVENDALGTMRKDVYQQANNTAAAITFANVLAGRRKLQDALAPPGNRTALLSSNDGANLVDALKGLFQDDGAISKQYREGYMGRTGGFDFAESTHLSTQLRGSGASYVVNTSTGITSGTATITTTGGTGTVNKGEVFTVGTTAAGICAVHPETKANLGVLMQFTVTSDQTTNAAWPVTPTPITSGPLQNCVIVAAGASQAVTLAGTASTNYGQSLVYHKDAFTFATADLVMPKGVDWGAREVYDGISLRIVRDYDINNDRLPCRVDILYGYKTLRAQLACRLANLAG
jgi:hypothetical protein